MPIGFPVNHGIISIEKKCFLILPTLDNIFELYTSKPTGNKLEVLSWNYSSDEFKSCIDLDSFDNCDTTSEVTVVEMVILMTKNTRKRAIEN
jgi:hypothetical protein